MYSTTTSQDQAIYIEPERGNEGRERESSMVVRNETTLLNQVRQIFLAILLPIKAGRREYNNWAKLFTDAMKRNDWKSFKRQLDVFPEEEERNVNEEDDNYSWTKPFTRAMERNNWKSFKKHLDLNSGAEVRKVNKEGETFLHRAIASGKKQFVIKLANLMTPKDLVLTDRDGYTALHLAVANGEEQFVRELVNQMSAEDLMLVNTEGCTALYLAAISGTKEMAEIMVKKKIDLVLVRNIHELPVVTAARLENTDMAHYLYEHTPLRQLNPDKGKDGATLLTKLISSDLFDIALKLLKKYPTLAKSEDYDGRNVITVLARKPFAFPSGHYGHWHQRKSMRGFKTRDTKSELQALHILKIISTQVSKMDDKQLKDVGVYEAVLEATKFGIVEFVYEVMKCNRHMLNCKDASGKGPFLYAIMYRQEKIFSLLQDMRNRNSLFNYIGKEDGNNTLHEAATYNRFSHIDKIPGVVFQIQHELQWFKEVEKLVPPILKDQRNSRGITPRELFADEHAALVEKGEKWMKETATGCMVVAALIATVGFTAAFQLPGGYDEKTGVSSLSDVGRFKYFIIYDAVSLFFSCLSMILFISIFTTRYGEQEFLISLPKKLKYGVSYLTNSVVFMLLAFIEVISMSVDGKLSTFIFWTSWTLALLVNVLLWRLTNHLFDESGLKLFVKKNK